MIISLLAFLLEEKKINTEIYSLTVYNQDKINNACNAQKQFLFNNK